jgi:C4-dicarboxylate-binding protein DctP
MKTSSKIIMIGIFFALLLFVGCQRQAETFSVFEEEKLDEAKNYEEPIIIILTHSEMENSLTHEIALKLKEVLERESENKFVVDVYPNNTFGSLTDNVEYFSKGAVEMRLGSGPSKIISIVKWLPSVIEINTYELNEALKPGHKLRNLVDEECSNYNAKIIGSTPLIYRMMTSNKKINSIEDFSKINIRVINDGIYKNYWEALGSQTSTFNIEQVYTALQQNIVDAQENTIPSIVSNKLYEQQKYLTITKHMLANDMLYVNQDFYNSLSPEKQELIEKAAKTAVDYGTSKTINYLIDGNKKLEAEGIEVVALPEEEKKKMNEIVKPIVIDYLKKTYGNELFEKILLTVNNKQY